MRTWDASWATRIHRAMGGSCDHLNGNCQWYVSRGTPQNGDFSPLVALFKSKGPPYKEHIHISRLQNTLEPFLLRTTFMGIHVIQPPRPIKLVAVCASLCKLSGSMGNRRVSMNSYDRCPPKAVNSADVGFKRRVMRPGPELTCNRWPGDKFAACVACTCKRYTRERLPC